MSLDLFTLAGSWFELLLARRLVVCLAIGIGAGWCAFHLGGEGPASAAVAFALGLLGLCTGLVWQIAGARRRSPP